MLSEVVFVTRRILGEFNRQREDHDIIALVGPRGSGKTTFLKKAVEPRGVSYVPFDDPDASHLFELDVRQFEPQYVLGNDLTIIDELQCCKDAGPKLRHLVDNGGKLCITSSSEVLLGEEVLSHLEGKLTVLRLYPFDLWEFLASRGQRALTPAILKRHVWEHMTYGGYPAVVMADDAEMKKTILSNLYDTILLKDVVRTFGIDDIGALELFMRYLAARTGGALVYDRVTSALDISFQTLKKYLDALVKSYLVVLVPPHYTNKSKEIAKQPRLYFLDTGLRNVIARDFGHEPKGAVFENYVLSECIKAGIVLKYWRTKTGAEVDFVAQLEGGELVPIEVKITAGPNNVESGYRSFVRAYSPGRGYVVSLGGHMGEVDVDGCRVTFTDVAGLCEALPGAKGGG